MSVIVFTVAVLMSAGTVVISSRMSQKVDAMRSVQDEARFIAEFISRETSAAESVEAMTSSSIASIGCTATGSCDTLRIKKSIDTYEYISLTPDSKGLQIMTEIIGVRSEPQIISSDNIMISKLNFTTQYSGKAVNVQLQVEENIEAKGKNFNSSKGIRWAGLYKPTEIELRFIASNLSNIPNLSF